MFIQHSIDRIEAAERRKLIPLALRGIANESSSTPTLFNILLRMLPALKTPSRGSKEDGSFREDIGLADPNDAKFVASWFGKLLLLKFQPDASGRSAGLTSSEASFLTLDKPETWNANSPGGLSLPETRIKIVNFLASGAFADDERFVPAIYAAAHTDNRVSTVGEELLKRSAVSLEEPALIASLFQSHSRLPPPYRIRILNVLSKSAASTAFTKDILAVVLRDMNSANDAEGSHASASAKGLELTKLYKALFEYINWVARIGPSKGDFDIGQPLIDHLRQYITSQGWPVPTTADSDGIALRSRAYETIGMLAKGTAMKSSERLSLVGWLFRSLSEDPTPDVVVNVDGALSSLAVLFKPPQALDFDAHLKSLLMTYMTVSDDEKEVVRSARHAATKWANNCLPFSDATGRWIDILAVAGRRGERSDVVEEGQKGLDPWTYYSNDSSSRVLPDWQVLVNTFFKEPVTYLNSREWRQGQGMEVDGLSMFVNFPGDRLHAFPLAVNYCKRILFLTALEDFKVEPGWERQLETLVQSDKRSRATIRQYLKTSTGDALFDLLAASFEGMLREQSALVEQCARCFVDVASLSPRTAVANLAGRVMELLPLIKSNKKEIRILAAKAVGILGAHPSNPADTKKQLLTALVDATRQWKTAVGSELNAAEGALVALGHFLSRLVYYSPRSASDYSISISEFIPASKDIAGAPSSFQEAVFDALAQLWTAGLAPMPKTPDFEENVRGLLEILTAQAKKSNERAINTMGRLCFPIDSALTDQANEKEGTADITNLVLETLFGLFEIKQAEVHLAIGDAITAAIARWDSDVVQLTLDVESDDTSYQVGKNSAKITEVLKKILTDCKTTKPALLKASGLWLFCIIQHCSHLPEIQSQLRECQVAFMRLLSARDELVQETASRGLALVYEKGDPSLKDDLVRDLVASFTGSGPKLKVDEDTELFDAGALPTGEGKSITSYKDIVNLANEVGDQSLIYKFMSLATNAATWSTRSAFGRFGLSSILSESEIDPKLYPKLYRYRFDPNKNVQRSMNDIWKALVKDSNAVMETHFDAIMQDLLKSILGKEWRVREASCAAIADLVQGRPFAQYEKFYQDVWTCALKVLDDVKTSVRNAALSLCMGLSNTLVRQLEDGSRSAAAKSMMNEALPFLMSEKGIESGVKDVKIFATLTVMNIAKNGGEALKPYIATMVPNLLGLLSTIEHEAINYHYLRSGEDDREKIDKLRSSMISQSPISEAIENCLRNVDATIMAALAPGLENTIKTAIGMPTKVGCSRVLSTLATRHASAFSPYSAKFLQLMGKQALDKNLEVSQGYARAAAYIMRVVPSEAKERFAEQFIDLYFTSEEETRRQKVADVILALSKISPDYFNALESHLLPLSYLGSHDTDEYVQKAFEEVWSKHAGSSLSVTRYVAEIAALVQRSLDTAQWALKHAGALTVAGMVKAVTGASDLSGQVNIASLRIIWPIYEKSLVLKTFPDKEKLLDAFPDFVGKGKAFWGGDERLAAQLKKIAVREAKRNNDAYRVHAFKCLWRFAAARDDLDMMDEIVEIVSPFMEELKDEDRMEVDKKDRDEDLARKTAANALEAVARGYSRQKMKDNSVAVLGSVLKALKPYLTSPHLDAVRREVWYKCVLDLMDAAVVSTQPYGGQGSDLVRGYFLSLDVDKPDVGTEDQRSTRAKACRAVARAVTRGIFGGKESLKDTIAQMKKVTEKALAGERSLDVQKLLKEALGEMS